MNVFEVKWIKKNKALWIEEYINYNMSKFEINLLYNIVTILLFII